MAAFSTCLRGSRLPQNNTLCILVVLAVPPDFNSMCAPCSLFEGLFVAEQPRQKKGLEPKRYSELLSVSEALGGEVCIVLCVQGLAASDRASCLLCT